MKPGRSLYESDNATVKPGRSLYEPEPVADIAEGTAALVSAYNRLQNILAEESPHTAALGAFAVQLRTTIGKSVPINNLSSLQISTYEVGIAIEAAPDAQLRVNLEKFRHALTNRPAETHTLFNHPEKGLLPTLLYLLDEFKNKNAPLNDAQDTYWQTIYPPLMRFMNECRRMQVFWSAIDIP